MSLSKLPLYGGNIRCLSDDDRREIIIPVDNMAEYQELIETAQRQLNDLKLTLEKLKSFEVKMKITF